MAATVLWSWRECGLGLWPVVVLAVKVSGPLQSRVTPIGEIGRRDGLKSRCLRACRFESCIGDIMIILLRTAVLRRVIFFYAEECLWFIVLGRGVRRTFRRIGRGFVRPCSRGMGIGVRRSCRMVASVRVLARSSVIIWVILRIIRCKRFKRYAARAIVAKRPRRRTPHPRLRVEKFSGV